MIIVVKLKSRAMHANVYPDDVEIAEIAEAPAEFWFEYRVAMARHGTRPLRHGGHGYRRCRAVDEDQARRFVEEEQGDGFRSWAERRLVGPWRSFKP